MVCNSFSRLQFSTLPFGNSQCLIPGPGDPACETGGIIARGRRVVGNVTPIRMRVLREAQRGVQGQPFGSLPSGGQQGKA